MGGRVGEWAGATPCFSVAETGSNATQRRVDILDAAGGGQQAVGIAHGQCVPYPFTPPAVERGAA